MKKTLALFIVAVFVFAAFSAINASADVKAGEDVAFAHVVAMGNDPYAEFMFNPDGNHTTIDPDTVKWASVRYRTITETDNTGVQLIGQFYICSAAEPFIPIKYVHSGQWETIIVDMTSVSEKTALASKWNSKSYTDTSKIRFDPLESNRDAEAAQGESDTAVVSDGDSIDIAWIAFFESEEDAKAYDGTQNTPYCIILPEDLEWPGGTNNIADPEVIKPRPPVTDAPEVPTEAPTEKVTEAPTEKVTEAPTEKVTEAPTEKATEKPSEDTVEPTIGADTKAPEDPAKPTAKSTFPVWAIILIAVAGVVLVCVIIMTVVTSAKKKK